MNHFSWGIDGSIVVLYLLVTMVAGIMVRKYVGKVEHFLVAGREVNVFLGIASLAATEFGVITCMYTAQAGYKYGFAGATFGILTALAMMFVGLTGFCVKPLREAGRGDDSRAVREAIRSPHPLGGRRSNRARRTAEHGRLPPHHRRVPGAGLRLRPGPLGPQHPAGDDLALWCWARSTRWSAACSRCWSPTSCSSS